ncbi:hypothetical protein A0H81_07532 [Grifola frondosa]|uniref:Uncharacterized protein n=1 Tax=Grifola frondosa TaxID=5627 RepID=A0A1C7MCH5_GRIFR|nr:hypothetical protein A0H81_07532 [Grifola frondosa]
MRMHSGQSTHMALQSGRADSRAHYLRPTTRHRTSLAGAKREIERVGSRSAIGRLHGAPPALWMQPCGCNQQ